MSLVTSALQIGRSALLTYQSALDVLGNNISNAGNADYTRQTAGLAAANGTASPEGFRPGAGVTMASLQRNLDEALEDRLRLAMGSEQSVAAEADTLSRIEPLFDEASGLGLAARLNNFFSSLDAVHTDPSDTALRAIAVSQGSTLASTLRQLRTEVRGVGEAADKQIGTLVDQINSDAADIAELNGQIVAAEAGAHAPASALRDQRDALLRDLSEIVDVTTRTQPDGSLYVFIGSEALVQGGVARALKTDARLTGELTQTAVVFSDTGSDVQPRSGLLRGLITARDTHAYGQIARIDELAAGIIAEVNRAHADGQGLVGLKSVIGTNPLLDSTVPLNDARTGLQTTPQNGSFFLVVSDDATGTPVAYRLDVDLDGQGTDTTLETLVSDINDNVSGVTASLTPDHRLKLVAGAGSSFTFGHDGQVAHPDTSGALAALGINTFFTGSNASDIAVDASLEAHPELLAASTVNLPGDGANAARLATVGTTVSTQLGNVSALDFYNSIAGDVAVTSAAAQSGADASGGIVSSLRAEKESVSGVSLDEEAIDLLKYERAFQGAARYVTVVNQMMDEMMTLVT
jgi:flagellar hook-associated protein 1